MEYINRVVRGRSLDLDKLGATASMLCAIHCLLIGIAFPLLVVLGLGFFGSFWTDAFFIGIALMMGALAARQGLRRHGRRYPLVVFAAAVVLVGIGHFVLGHESALGTVLSVAGGLGLVTFHVINLRLLHSFRCADSRLAT